MTVMEKEMQHPKKIMGLEDEFCYIYPLIEILSYKNRIYLPTLSFKLSVSHDVHHLKSTGEPVHFLGMSKHWAAPADEICWLELLNLLK